jgi:hypothetical protein
VIDPAEADAALALDDAWRGSVRQAWTRIAELAVFGDLRAGAIGDLRAGAIGALPRLRKRVLDLGERLRALAAARDWIPQPRERLKNALAAAIGARDALAEVRGQAGGLTGADAAAFEAALAALASALEPVLGERANAWAALLARRHGDDDNA